MHSPSCTIVVCTYNRAESLRTTLQYLIKQDFGEGTLEVLVVDNNSDDRTREVVDEFLTSEGVPVRYLFEPVQGLSRARNSGVAQSEAEIVIFIDDDAYPEDVHWANKIVAAFSDASVGAAGGDAKPVWPEDGGRPGWLHDDLLPYLGIVSFDYSELHQLHYPHYPYGVNIAFRRTLLQQLGGFAEGVGRLGEVLLSGEEIELCKRVEEGGGSVVYVPAAAVHHVMAPGRLTREWFLRRAGFQGTSKALIEWKEGSAKRRLMMFSKRIVILFGAAAASLLLPLIGMAGLGFVARCKLEMSKTFLRYAVGSRDNR